METRKDSLPQETIQKVEEILKKIGINVIEKEKFNYMNYWYSVRLEIEGLDGVGVNGKGISEDYALASAYGELMERLQSGTLVDNLYSAFHTPQDDKYYGTQEELYHGLEYISYKSNFGSCRLENKKIWKKALYVDYITQKEVELPEWFIDMDCLTTGLCAGNTFYEAVVQGIFEIFERNARKKIYEGTMEVTLVQESELKELYSFKLLCEIRKQGYDWNVIDCTDGGKYPVLGILIWDRTRENYLFVMGSDLDLDICIQRCITELFQGRQFDFLFYKYMENVYDIYEEKDLELNVEYQKTVLCNEGKVPYHVLFCGKSTKAWKRAFQKGVNTNKDVFRILAGRIKKSNYTLYIRDMSYYGFPTYRVYIPGLSEVVEASKYHIKYEVDTHGFYDKISNLNNCKKEDIKTLITQMKLVESLPFNSSVSIIRRAKGVVLSENEIFLYNEYLLFVLYSLTDDLDNAKKELIRLGKKNIYLKKKVFPIYINYIAKMENEYRQKINRQLFRSDNTDSGIYYINCPDCENCLLREYCRIDNWKSIMNKLKIAKQLEFEI